MENYFEILKKCRMFTGFDIEDIKCLTEILNSKVVKYSKGDVIFSEGEKPEHIGVVLHGNAQIERTLRQSQYSRCVGAFGGVR